MNMMKYDIEAAWNLLTSCNFQCGYCFFPPHEKHSRINIYGTSAQWLEGFNATGKTWLIHVSGGEPSIYPGFVDLCEHLSRNHYLTVSSNLSHESIDDFAERINPERIQFIHAAVHFEERQKRSLLETFVERVQKLRIHKFTVLVSLVMTPEAVSAYPAISRYFESREIPLIPKVLRGKYRGRKYPLSYSPEEKSNILAYLMESQRNYTAVIAGMSELPTMNPLSDSRLLEHPRRYFGRICGSGYNFVKIESDGTVVRCSSRLRLGNILQKDVRLLRFPLPCISGYCPYYCEKYTSPQFLSEHHGMSSRDSLPHWIRRLFMP